MMGTRKTVVVLAGLVMASWGTIRETYGEEQPQDVIKLFNGKNLDGWVEETGKGFFDWFSPKGIWTVKDGVIHCTGAKYGWLRYDRKFDDFVFHVEYRMLDAKSNSGLGIRTVRYDRTRKTRPSLAAYEIQLLNDVDRPASRHSTGSLYRYVAPAAKPIRPAPQWNTMEVRCEGPRIVVTLNGQRILDFDQSTDEQVKDKPLSGYLSIQSHNGPVEFRNLWVEPLAKSAERVR